MITTHPQATMNACAKSCAIPFRRCRDKWKLWPASGASSQVFGTMNICIKFLSFFFFFVLTGWLKYPISQSVCGESVRPSSHSGDDASWLPQGQVVHLCKCKHRINLGDFRHQLSEAITRPTSSLSLAASFFSLSIPLHPFPILSPCIIFCIASSETATSPWRLGSAAPALRFVGWIVSRTNQCSACVRPPRGHAQRWVVISCSTLVIQTALAAIYSSNRFFFASFTLRWESGLISLNSQMSTGRINI